MQHTPHISAINPAVMHYLNRATHPTEEKALGSVIVELLRDGKRLSRKSLCTRLLGRLELAAGTEEEALYQNLIGYLFER
ncbi:hypothetical protein TUM12370_13560 [Salmonella enterica subsp. enterica serovar Choleraesuis]|nr:hypothetical protein TUM12370_13560 [Salmonella enterica subsp. enterica serovar Choleraesuis]